MKQKFILFLFLFLTNSLVAQDFKILASDEQSIEVEFTLPQVERIRLLGEDGVEYQRFKMDHLAKTDQGGYPELPLFATMLQVPPNGDIQLEILQQHTDTTSVPSIYPVPKPVLSKNKDIIQQFTKQTQAYQAVDFYPEQLISLEQRALLRGVPVVRVKVYPVQWQAKTGILRYTSSLRFKLHFSHPLPPLDEEARQGHYEPLLRQVIQGYRARKLSRDNEQKVTQGPKHNTFQFKVNKSGIYQLSYETLFASGLPESCLSQGQFVLHHRTQQVVPQKVTSSRGFRKGDLLEFYAQAFEDTYADTNIYRLECWELFSPQPYGSQFFPKKSLVIKGTPSLGTQPVDHFKETLRFEENKGLWLETPNSPTKDYWFWKRIKSPEETKVSLSIFHPVESTENVSLTLALQGEKLAKAATEHRIDVYFNDSHLGQITWGEQEDKIETFQFPSNLLVGEENTLRLSFPEEAQAEGGIFYLNWVEVSYLRQLVLEPDELKFSLSGEGRVPMKLTNLNSSPLRIFDITDPSHVREVIDFTIIHEGDTVQTIFEDELRGEKTYYATTTLHQIEQGELLPPSLLKQSNQQADYLIITSREFLPVVEPLLQYHENQGLHSRAVGLEDIYSEFGFGFPTPYAIKDFLSYAYHHWQAPAPSYVLLFGDSSVDYKHRIASQNKADLIPPYLIETLFGVTPDDNWFVSVEGEDPLPEMMIGRLPGGKEKDISALINKIMSYETTPQDYHGILLVSDNAFEKMSDKMQERYFSNVPVNKLYLKDYAKEELEQAKEDLIQYLNEGQWITQYIGHGNMSVWAEERLFQKSSMDLLNNQDKLTWVLALSCLNGYFAAPGQYALGEDLVRTPDKGAIAVFSSSGYGYSGSYEMITHELFSRIFEGHQTRLGELVTQSKIAIYGKGADKESLSVFTLLGDPASILHTP